MKPIKMSSLGSWEPAREMRFNTIVGLEEISHHDMIYIYHHIQVDSEVQLEIAGENIKGDQRCKVLFRDFVLGYVTISGPLRNMYSDLSLCTARICHIQKKKFLPISEIDLSIQATKSRMVS